MRRQTSQKRYVVKFAVTERAPEPLELELNRAYSAGYELVDIQYLPDVTKIIYKLRI